MPKKDQLTNDIEGAHLHKIKPQPVWGEKCAHGVTSTDGRQTGLWAVKLEAEFYIFDPPTQMQKDIWLMETYDRSGERDEYIRAIKLGALRWYCAQCGTVQEP